MTVWVLQKPWDPEGPVWGVFSSLEKAKAYAKDVLLEDHWYVRTGSDVVEGAGATWIRPLELDKGAGE